MIRAWDITLVTANAAQRMVDAYCMFAVVVAVVLRGLAVLTNRAVRTTGARIEERY